MRKQITVGEVAELLRQNKKVKVKTLNGELAEITQFIEKGTLETFLVETENRLSIKVSREHKFFERAGWIEVKDAVAGRTEILCEDGTYSKIVKIEPIGAKRIVDITVNHPEHCYFGNGILNHNSGKSYMAAQIAGNAQKKGITVVYFDSESAIDPRFLEMAGCDLSSLLYIQADSVEFVLETIEDFLKQGEKFLFIWDSMALTPSKTDIEGDFDPLSSMAVKPRILAKGLSKLVQPLANKQSTILVLNQLKTNLANKAMYPTDSDKFTTPGGRALSYAYSLRIWLTARKAKDAYVLDERGYRVGSEVKARLEKSRFGTQGRECFFKIIWGGMVGVLDDESVFEAIKPFIQVSGAWYTIEVDGEPIKFQSTVWTEKMKETAFKKAVYDLMDKEVIIKFDTREGDSKNFYDIEGTFAETLEAVETI